MRYQMILEFDEDWVIDEVMRMLQEKRIDCFYQVIDTEEMEHITNSERDRGGKYETRLKRFN